MKLTPKEKKALKKAADILESFWDEERVDTYVRVLGKGCTPISTAYDIRKIIKAGK